MSAAVAAPRMPSVARHPAHGGAASRSSSVTAPWRLASRAPSGPSTSGTWAYAGAVEPEQPGEEELARRRLQQVVAAHDLADALPGVVDDHGEVVGGRAVVAAHDEVVDDALLRRRARGR